jgi:O-antigen/teichoic acid export membrane protein
LIRLDGLTKNILSVISTRLLLKAINFLSLYILLRYLTEEQLGEYGLFIATLVLSTTLGNLGLRNSAASAIGSKGESSLTINSLVFAYPLMMFFSVFIMLCILYFNGFFLTFSFKTILIIIAVLCHLIIVLRQGVCLGLGEIKLFNILEILPRISMLVVIILVINFFNTVYDNVAIASLTFGYLVSAGYAVKKTNFNLKLAKLSHCYFLFKTGFAFCLALTLILVNTNIPLYMTNYLNGVADAGQVFAALRVNDIFLELATAAGLVLFSHSARKKNNDDLKKVYKTITGVVVVTIFISLLVVFFASDLILLLTGKGYKEAAMYLTILSLGLPFSAFNKMAYGVLSGKGRPALGVLVYSIVVPVNILLVFLLYKQDIDGFVLYALVTSQMLASILFLTLLFNLNKNRILDEKFEA